jgi:hypothetical protein
VRRIMMKKVFIVSVFVLLTSLLYADDDSDYVKSSNKVQAPGAYHITFPYSTVEKVKGFVNPEQNVKTKNDWYLFYVCIPHVTPDRDSVYGMNIGLPFTEKINNIYGLDLSLSNYARNVYGLQMSILVNNNYNSGGLQFSLINSTQNVFCGMEIGASNADNNIYGVQIAAINNIKKYGSGVQLGLINDVLGKIHGGQLGLINVAKKIGGFQLGLINRAEDTKSSFNFQLGLINSNDKGECFQLGLINYNPNAWLKYFPLINFSF